ncbi:MAG: methyl-accepting chemotaxis protein [Exilispira sp.]
MSYKRFINIFIIFLFLFSIIFFFQSCKSNKSENAFISISEDWDYKFYRSNEKDFSDSILIASGKIDLPVNFKSLIKNGQTYPERGIVYLNKTIEINYNIIKNSKFIGIYFGKIIDCSEIYIDGNLISKNGIFKNYFFTSWNKNILVKIPNLNKKGIEKINIEMKVYYHPDGSVQDRILLGDYDQLRKIERINNLIDIDLKLVFLLISILFVVIFFYIGLKLKYNYYIYFSLLTFQLTIFTLIYVLTDLPIEHSIFNYLFEYKSIYLACILIILFITEYLNEKADKILKSGIILSFIGFILDTIIFNRFIRLIIYQAFNLLLYLIFIYLVIYVFRYYLKNKTKKSQQLLFSIFILFLSLTNDLLSFQFPDLIKSFYPENITLKYLNIYGYQLFIIIIATNLVRDLVNSFYRLSRLTKDLDKISFELKNQKELLVDNVQKILDEAKESFISSEKLSQTGNDFNKFLYNLKDQIQKMKDSLILSSKNEERISEKIKQLFNKLENVQQGYNNTNKILGIVIEKIDQIILNTNNIENIVEQTSLLSLNSSVIAGKAMEKGKGFSIISDEIRKLALKSANFSSSAHKGIENILKSLEETRIRSKEFLVVFNEYIEKYNKLIEYLKVNQENHNNFNNKIEQMINMIEKISLLANEIDEKSKKLYELSNENINVNMEI